MAVLDGYGIHIRSRMNAHWYNRDGYPASIVFMEFHVGLLQVVSMAILYGYGIHIRIRMRARWYNRDGYPASNCVYGISSETAGQHSGAGWVRYSHSQQNECALIQ